MTIGVNCPEYRIFNSHFYMMNSLGVRWPGGGILVDPGVYEDEVDNIRAWLSARGVPRDLTILYTHLDYDHIIDPPIPEGTRVSRYASRRFTERDPEMILKAWETADATYYMGRERPRSIPQGITPLEGDEGRFHAGPMEIRYSGVPGHTADSMSYFIPSLGIAVVGDVLSDFEPPGIGTSGSEYERSLVRLEHSLEDWGPDLLMNGHGRPVMGDGWKPRMEADLAYVRELLAVAAAVARDECSRDEGLTKVRYAGVSIPEWHWGAHIKNLGLCVDKV